MPATAKYRRINSRWRLQLRYSFVYWNRPVFLFALQQKRLAKQKADQIRDLLFRLAHLFVIVGNPCFCLYNFRHVLVLLTNTKPG